LSLFATLAVPLAFLHRQSKTVLALDTRRSENLYLICLPANSLFSNSQVQIVAGFLNNRIDKSDALKFFEALFLPQSFSRSFFSGGADLLPPSFRFLLGRGGSSATLPHSWIAPGAGSDFSGDISTSVEGFQSACKKQSYLERRKRPKSRGKL
jgi:hypothetical protein